MHVTLLDTGSGNIPNVIRALEYVGASVQRVAAPDQWRDRAGPVVLPGVGHFGSVMGAIRSQGLDQAINEVLLGGEAPFLGICVGLQALFERSAESDVDAGLGLLNGSVQDLRSSTQLQAGAKVPHMGWNEVEPVVPDGLILEPGYAYFVHRYYVAGNHPACIARTQYAGVSIAAAVRLREHAWAVQFHPEKSGPYGLELLRRFVESA